MEIFVENTKINKKVVSKGDLLVFVFTTINFVIYSLLFNH